MSKIIIKGLEVYAYHGVKENEKLNGQNFFLDITLNVKTKNAAVSDNIEDTVNYSKTAKLARKLMLADKYNLIETAAQKIADGILAEFKNVKKVKVLLKKPEAPIKGLNFDYVAVKICKKR